VLRECVSRRGGVFALFVAKRAPPRVGAVAGRAGPRSCAGAVAGLATGMGLCPVDAAVAYSA
jgi:hypothetical protein